MRVVLIGHCWEANSVVIADSLVEEQALDSDLQAVEGYLGLHGSDYVELPEFVEEVEASI